MSELTPRIVDVHTPTRSFSITHFISQDTIDSLFDKLKTKAAISHELLDEKQSIGTGWVKYEWNGGIWDLDDESDYTIFSWRQTLFSVETEIAKTTLHLRNPALPLPAPPVYLNSSYYAFKVISKSPSSTILIEKPGSGSDLKLKLGRRDAAKPTSTKSDLKEMRGLHHGNECMRTVTGTIGPARNVRMLLKAGYRHIYISRAFAKRHKIIPDDVQPGLYGYIGLVNLGQWPVVVGKTKTIHTIYVSEETHFDCILGRSFIERRKVRMDPNDMKSVSCLDTGEQIDCELVIIQDGQVVTIS